jgi:gluconolactonase
MNWSRLTFVFVAFALIMGCGPQNESRSRDASTSRVGGGPAPRADREAADFAIIKLDPALDAIVSPDAMLETIGDRFGLSEGPVWVREGASGYLLFSDLIANVIYKWTAGGLSVFLENVYDGADILNVGQQTRRGRMHVIIGANGLTLDREGRLIIASPASRAVFRLEQDGKRTVIADRYDGKRFNGPNDVVVKSNGSIYFTDGNSGLRGGANSPQRELPFNGFYLVRGGNVTLVGSNKEFPQGFPNGIALSPDETRLYVTIGRKIMRYDVQVDDTVANAVEFLDVAGNDGMKVDANGNVFSTTGAGPGEVRITSPDGKRLGTLRLPQPPGEPREQICATNVGFGDADGKGLYITACTHVYHIRLNSPGMRPGPSS